jgi:hypothetical protein
LEAKPLDIPVKLIIPTSSLSLKHPAPNLENSNISRITPRDESFKPIHYARALVLNAFNPYTIIDFRIGTTSFRTLTITYRAETTSYRREITN